MRCFSLARLVLCVSVVAIACGDDVSKGIPDAGTDAGTDAGPDYAYPITDVSVEWFPCSFIYGEDDGLAECSSTAMPLFWNNPDGRTLEVYAKRLLSAQPVSEGQIWFLHGGPGASGVEGLPALMEKIQNLYPELDVYTIDHRGVGDSGKLVCPEENEQDFDVEVCIEQVETEIGDELQAYTTSDSAIDLAAYIEATREPGKKALIWGGSYGTFIGHRYLKIFPHQSDGVVFEGVCPADSTFIWSQEGFDQAGKDLFDACLKDDYCSMKWGKNPLDRIKKLFERVWYQDHCSDAENYQYYVPYVATRLLYYYPYHDVVPALLYRLARCEPGDITAIEGAVNMLFGSDSTYQDLGEGYSGVLYRNVVYSEMWEHSDFPDPVSLQLYWNELEADAVFWTGSGESMYDEWDVWPKYNDELHDDIWAQTDVPMLMLQGMLDPATHYSRAVAMGEQLNGPNQTFLLFPTAAHNITSGTPVSDDPEETHCGRHLMVEFLKNPDAPLDTSCMDQVLFNDFEGNTDLAQEVFGVSHLWENGVSYSSERKTPISRADADYVRAELRRRARQDLPDARRHLGYY